MYNPNQQENLAQLKKLIESEGYTDLGWANDGKNFSLSDNERIQTVRQLDCSLYSLRGTHIVYVDDESKEILHVDMSD